MRTAIAVVIALAMASTVEAQEHRLGLAVVNFGPIIAEDSAHVRIGNMGNEFGGLWAEVDVGDPGGLFVGLEAIPTVITVWENTGPINRWSHRPTSPKRHHRFTMLIPYAGWRCEIPYGFQLRPKVGLWWPASTDYSWGAPVGANLWAGLEAIKELGWLHPGLNVMVGYNRPHAWTVLQDWSTPERGVADPRGNWIVAYEARLGVAVGPSVNGTAREAAAVAPVPVP